MFIAVVTSECGLPWQKTLSTLRYVWCGQPETIFKHRWRLLCDIMKRWLCATDNKNFKGCIINDRKLRSATANTKHLKIKNAIFIQCCKMMST